MKKLLSLLFILAGLAFAHSASAQTSSDTTKTKKGNKEAKKSGSGSTQPGGITIDEGGTPKVRGKKPATSTNNGNGAPAADSTKSAPKQQGSQSSQKTSGQPAPGSPDMAIDEGGTPKEKPSPVIAPQTGLSSDSSAIHNTSGLERPH
jgi:hypothetical protein